MTFTAAPARTTEAIGAALMAAGIVLLALLTLYLVGFDNGAISRSGMFLHELMHDGRHLLALPCH